MTAHLGAPKANHWTVCQVLSTRATKGDVMPKNTTRIYSRLTSAERKKRKANLFAEQQGRCVWCSSPMVLEGHASNLAVFQRSGMMPGSGIVLCCLECKPRVGR